MVKREKAYREVFLPNRMDSEFQQDAQPLLLSQDDNSNTQTGLDTVQEENRSQPDTSPESDLFPSDPDLDQWAANSTQLMGRDTTTDKPKETKNLLDVTTDSITPEPRQQKTEDENLLPTKLGLGGFFSSVFCLIIFCLTPRVFWIVPRLPPWRREAGRRGSGAGDCSR